MLVIFFGAIYAEQLNRENHRQRIRADLLDTTNLVASRLQGVIAANIELVRGMAAVVAVEPTIDQSRFASLAESLFKSDNQLNNIGAAPDMKISMVFPVAGNEKVFGLDYRKLASQRDMALKARDDGKMVLAGPVGLVQGGQGFLVHFPVFYQDEKHKQVFWGLMSAVINTKKVYQAAGLNAATDIEFSIRGKDAGGRQGAVFYGPVTLWQQNPVSVDVNFGFGSWQLAAIPKQGWYSQPDNVWVIRSSAALAMLVVAIPFAAVGWLSRERLSNLRALLRGQAHLARISKRLELAVQIAQIGIWEYDIEQKRSNWDEKMFDFYGIDKNVSPEEANWQQYLHPDDRETILKTVREVMETEGTGRGEFRICMPDGRLRTMRTIASMQVDKNGKKRLIGVNWDISEDIERTRLLTEARAESERRNQLLEEANASIEVHSLHDFLTELPNRRYLDAQLNRTDIAHEELFEQISLLKIDLDGFKEVNDSLGNAAGDAMLIHSAELLRAEIEEDEFVARIGGDEFVVICRRDKDCQRPLKLAATIIRKFQPAILYQGRECRLGTSIGIAHGTSAVGDADKLLSYADLALYQSKQNGKGCYSVFRPPLYHAAKQQRQLADDIIHGLERDEFVAYFQGQYCAKTHNLCGAESLVRWNHPQRGLLGPQDFLDTAEQLGVVGAIDQAVLEQAIEVKKNWKRQGLDLPRISVNVSAKRLGDKNLIANLEKLDFNPSEVTFELVESTFLDKSDELVAWNIDQIREMGIDIEIDDFGTAYASIISLTHLLPNRLKIDRQLVAPTIESESQRELVRSIVHIGHVMGIGSVAEGIETMDHALIMRAMGVDILQGYAFCKPISADDFYMKHMEIDTSRTA